MVYTTSEKRVYSPNEKDGGQDEVQSQHLGWGDLGASQVDVIYSGGNP